jgi:hypothetical protein
MVEVMTLLPKGFTLPQEGRGLKKVHVPFQRSMWVYQPAVLGAWFGSLAVSWAVLILNCRHPTLATVTLDTLQMIEMIVSGT